MYSEEALINHLTEKLSTLEEWEKNTRDNTLDENIESLNVMISRLISEIPEFVPIVYKVIVLTDRMESVDCGCDETEPSPDCKKHMTKAMMRNFGGVFDEIEKRFPFLKDEMRMEELGLFENAESIDTGPKPPSR